MEQFNQFLKEWMVEVLGEDIVVTDDFVPVVDKPQVTVFLHEITSTAPSHRHTAGPLEIGLDYIISVNSVGSVTESNELLKEIIFFAMENEELEVDLSPPPPAFWVSLGIKSRPCFRLKTKQIKERKLVTVPLVTEPIDLTTATAVSLHGRIKSPTDLPIVGAFVEIPNDNLSVRTDADGRFSFGSLMPEPDKKKVVIYYKQYSIEKTVSISKSPVEIIFKL